MVLIAGIIFFITLFNAVFLEKYYLKMQEKAIIQAYERIDSVIYEKKFDSEKLKNVIYDISSSQNIHILVTDSSFREIYYSDSNIDKTLRWLQDNLYSLSKAKETKILKKNNLYVVQTSYNVYDKRSYIELIGNDSGYMYNIIIQVPLESISKSVDISNHFFITVGLFTMLLGGIIAFIVARQFSEPILRLSKTAEAVAQMNFDAKYETSDKGEIGVLGNSINKMAENLKQYISDLKSANLKLQKDIEKREELDEMRKDFVSNVSHELKTPIALIQGYAEGLKDGISDDPESREYYCDVIIDEAAKMNKMVKQLLTLNQLESGNEPLDIERFDISGHIEEIVKANRIRAQQKCAEIIFAEYEPIYVWADQFKIEEVVTNYISNAVNHVDKVDTDEAYIEVRIKKDDKKVRISVYNTGKCIPKEDLDKIWDKFYKVDKARTRQYGGSGVGLSIVKAIMDSHNQCCGVINHEKGVEFWFELDCENV